MPRVLPAVLMAAAAAFPATAQDWGQLATISSTLGVNANRLCLGEGTRSDIGCPTYAPSITTAGHVSVTGNLSANAFIGDGSRLTNIGQGDRITSGTSNVTVAQNGSATVSTAGTQRMIVSSNGYVGVGTTSPQSELHIAGTNPQLRLTAGSLEDYLTLGANSGDSGHNVAWIGFNATVSHPYVPVTARINSALPGWSIVTKATGGGSENISLFGIDYVSLAGGSSRVVQIDYDGRASFNSGDKSLGGTRLSVNDSQNGSPSSSIALIKSGYEALGYRLQRTGYTTSHWYVNNPAWSTDFRITSLNSGASGDRLTIQSSGNVGIGTTTPSTTLHVGGSFMVSTSAQTTTPSLYVATNGNVGIGTNSPAYPLSVEVNSNVANDVIQVRNSSTGSSAQARIRFDNNNTPGSASNGVIFYTGGNYGAYPANSFGFWNHSTNGIVAIATSDTERVRITSAGNVGIGTTNPNAKLDVYGTISATNILVNGAPITATADRITSGTTQITANLNGPISFTTAGTERMVINSSGNVGIGTTSPSKTLDVSGTAQIVSRTLVGGTGTPSATLQISGSLLLAGNDNIPCTASVLGLIRRNPSTGRMQACR